VPSSSERLPLEPSTSLPIQKSLIRRLPQFALGIAGMSLGLAVMLEAGIGVGPWAVFHDGIARVTPLTFGQALVLVGVFIGALAWFWTGERPGLGTLVNMVSVGPLVDLFRGLPVMPAPEAWPIGLAQFIVGLLIIALATGAYITARFGAGPRDMFMLGLSQKLGFTVRRTRTLIEITVLLCGILLGGSVGLGTVLFAVAIGPTVQTTLRIFRYQPSRS